MAKDIADWNENLTEIEKRVIGNVLKGFTQTEVYVNDYWSTKVSKWFQHPEVGMMAAAFSNMEAIHAHAYSYLNDSLGLDDYEAFLHDPASKAKIDRLIGVKDNSLPDIARSLAIFSAFTEGVSLFSSFAILMSLTRSNKLKGLGQIVSWSIRDESLHSEAGCWLFRTLVQENPKLLTDSLKKDILEAARLTVKLEDDFIDRCFATGVCDDYIDEAFELTGIDGLDPQDLKQFIRHRANCKLQDLGLASNWRNIDVEAVNRLMWFEALAIGKENTDFFDQRPTAYSKGHINWDNIYEGLETDVS